MSGGSTSVTGEIKTIDRRLKEITRLISELNDEKQQLLARKEELRDQSVIENSKKRSGEDWSGTNFPWSNKIQDILMSVFKMETLRPLQLETINATMSKQDVILIMPTGGGKSMCFQLPALLSTGITLVISPLVSLMEDQVHGLLRMGVEAIALSSGGSAEDAKMASEALKDPKAKLRLLYVTPERLAKSKRFMSQLQKCASQGRFARMAIDEVHCCSTWGHDFRPDYNYLGILKDMFPDVPILGLTATCSTQVTIDVQKMLNIQNALVFRAPLNRPNLFYTVLKKPDSLEKCAQLLSEWLSRRYRGMSGIIYTNTIRESEDLCKALRKLNIKAGIYHASMEPADRAKAYDRWINNEYQLVVATIAFGLGINKPDVRFVIHHVLSKSMETLYQESGRAGRDGSNAECILMYRIQDVFKISTMVFTQRTGLENLYGLVRYCIEPTSCRRLMIANHFNEETYEGECGGMCDRCLNKSNSHIVREINARDHCRNLYKILEHASGKDSRLTALKLLDAWLHTGDSKLRVKEIKPPSFGRETAEIILASLLVRGYIKEDFHYTAYSTISYLMKGGRQSQVDNDNHEILVRIPKLETDLPSTFAKPSFDFQPTPKQSESPSRKKTKMDEERDPPSRKKTKTDEESDSPSRKKTKLDQGKKNGSEHTSSRKKAKVEDNKKEEVFVLDSDSEPESRKSVSKKSEQNSVKEVCVLVDSESDHEVNAVRLKRQALFGDDSDSS